MLAISTSAKLAGVVWSVMVISQRLDMFGCLPGTYIKKLEKKAHA